MKMRRTVDSGASRRWVLGSCASILLLLAAPVPSWASQECAEYASITLLQVETGRLGIRRNNAVGPPQEACPGVDAGPRWSQDTAGHFKWCLVVTPAQRAAETEARRGALKYCTAKRGELKWPDWDTVTHCSYSAGGGCLHSPNELGKQRCIANGNEIMNAVQKIRQDPTLLHDPVRDKSLYWSRYYHSFSHWTGFRCEIRVETRVTTSFSYYKLEGSTFGPRGPDSITRRPAYVR